MSRYHGRNTMEKLAMKTIVARVAVASLRVCAATLAQAGGNGNGGKGNGHANGKGKGKGNGNGKGNGRGGAPGAATAGMTYHSEAVSSPWNSVPGNMRKTA